MKPSNVNIPLSDIMKYWVKNIEVVSSSPGK
jgi:hypothetical protein